MTAIDERERFGRHISLGQAQRDRSGPDSARLSRCGSQWQQAPSHAEGGKPQGESHEGRDIPGDVEDELAQDRVDQLVAARFLGDQHG